MEKRVICAISTPIGTGGIGIVRMSGEGSLDFLSKLCGDKVFSLKPREMKLMNVSTQSFVESALVVYFKAPFSYTGEDMVEIQCHGGVVIVNGILKELIKNGATLASNGEFTKRAFLNGKLSLDKAEGVIDMINAESEAEIRAGYNLLKGNLARRVEQSQNMLKDVLAHIEVTLDYPEHDIDEITMNTLEQNLKSALLDIQTLINTSKSGKLIKAGVKILIIGKPNVGKSSLLNSLLGYKKAIVTEIAGTTRDIIEDTYLYNGVKFNIVDTAGIRQSKELVEQIGIDLAKEQINEADIILCVLNGHETLGKEDNEIIDLVKDKKVIFVINKTDLQQNLDVSKLNFGDIIKISAEKQINIDNLKQRIYDKMIDENILASNVVITNTRQEMALLVVETFLQNAISSLLSGETLDLVALDVKNAWTKLGEITGSTSSEEIIDAIFSKFCVGK